MQIDLKKIISNQLELLRIARGHRSIKDLADDFKGNYGIKYDSLNNYYKGSVEPKASLFFALYEMGINLDWFVTGEGEMYRANRTDQPHDDATTQPYAPRQQTGGNTVVTNNGIARDIVAEANTTYSVGQGGRGLPLCDFARWLDKRYPQSALFANELLKRFMNEYQEYLSEGN